MEKWLKLRSVVCISLTAWGCGYGLKMAWDDVSCASVSNAPISFAFHTSRPTRMSSEGESKDRPFGLDDATPETPSVEEVFPLISPDPRGQGFISADVRLH